jgi:hypothetical protein
MTAQGTYSNVDSGRVLITSELTNIEDAGLKPETFGTGNQNLYPIPSTYIPVTFNTN